MCRETAMSGYSNHVKRKACWQVQTEMCKMRMRAFDFKEGGSKSDSDAKYCLFSLHNQPGKKLHPCPPLLHLSHRTTPAYCFLFHVRNDAWQQIRLLFISSNIVYCWAILNGVFHRRRVETMVGHTNTLETHKSAWYSVADICGEVLHSP